MELCRYNPSHMWVGTNIIIDTLLLCMCLIVQIFNLQMYEMFYIAIRDTIIK